MIQAGIGDKLGVFLQYISTFVVGYIVAFSISWKLTLVCATMFPFLVLIGILVTRVRACKEGCMGID